MAEKVKRTLVYDISSILFRVAVMQKRNPFDTNPEDLVGLCFHISLYSILKWYTKYKPDFVVFAFEGGNNWRKEYTSKVGARQSYKGNREYDPAMAHLYELIASFKHVIQTHTSICCLAVDGTEADDSIASFVQLNAKEGEEIIIVSGDKDFIQLLKEPGVKLIDPDTGKARNQPGDKNYEADLDYWLFLKCIRGDGGDHVPSAYPRVRETKLKIAWNNQYDRINLMNETWSMTDIDGVEHTYRVGDLYEQNKILLSLYDQPAEIRTLLETEVTAQSKQLGTYSHFHFLRFLEDYKLVKVRQDAMKFVELFANNQRFIKGEQRAIDAKTQMSVSVSAEDQPIPLSSDVAAPKAKTLMEF
jgi:5'-3' exonuclease